MDLRPGEPRRKLPPSLMRPLPPRTATLSKPISGTCSPIVDGLNAAQRTAVTTSASIVQILAPPGSGKTRTLTSRVAFLLSNPQLNLEPQNVVVATFTVKAANEMKERLSKLVGDTVARRLLLGTFHSIARRYLLKYGHLIGLKSGWGIADSSDSKAICKRIIKRNRLSDTVDPRQLQPRISHFKARNLSPQADALPIVQSINPSTQQSHKRQKDIANDDFILLYESYQAALESSNLLDYDDILLRCLQMLKQHPMCVSNIQAVLIDEFQDTNVVQYELMKHFAWKQNCITVVGDPDQSIYGFRAAEIGNVRRMQKHYRDTLVVNLEENYRSSASILQAAMVVIQQDCQRVDKTLTATLPIGTSPVLRRMPTAAAEAEWIVGEIKRLEAITGNMIPMDGIAILVRSAHLTRLIETALTRQGLAYKMVGGTRFFDRAEVKIIIDYLRILQNPSSNDALARVINVPSRKIGEQTIKQFLDEAEMKNNSLWDTIHRAVRGDTPWGVKISKLAEKGIVSFVWLILNARKRLNNEDGQNAELSLVEIVEHLLVKLDYQHYLKKEYPEEFDNRWANIGELIAQAHEVSLDEDDALPMIDGVEQQAVAQKTVRAALEHFLANVALVNEKQHANHEEKVKEITITTIHAAKGLEWPVVFVPAVYEGSIPHSRAEDIDEERRLLYVAMTRARALLYMSCPFQNSGTDKLKLSPFINNPNVYRLVSKRASDMPFSCIQTLAQILGFRCPSELEIEAVIENSGILSRYDDQISDLDSSKKSDTDRQEQLYEKKRLDGPVVGGGVDGVQLFQGAKGWTNAGTTVDRLRGKMTTADKIGFRTASNHFSDLQKQGDNVTCEAEKIMLEKRTSHNRMMGKGYNLIKGVESNETITSKYKKGRTAAAGTATRGTLLDFFVKKPSASAPPPSLPAAAATVRPKLKRNATATDMVKTWKSSEMSLREQMESLPAPVIPKRAAGEFLLLSSSPPKPRAMKKFRAEMKELSQATTRYISDECKDSELLSTMLAEPPSFITVNEADQFLHAEEVTLPDIMVTPSATTEDVEMCSVPSSSAIGNGYQSESQNGLVELQSPDPLARNNSNNNNSNNNSNDFAPPNRNRGSKRTLGIRRSMNGWQNRGGGKLSRPFIAR